MIWKKNEFSELTEVEKKIQKQIQDAIEERKKTAAQHQELVDGHRNQLNEIRNIDYPTRAEHRDAVQSVKDLIEEAKEVKREALVTHDETINWLKEQLKDARNEITVTDFI